MCDDGTSLIEAKKKEKFFRFRFIWVWVHDRLSDFCSPLNSVAAHFEQAIDKSLYVSECSTSFWSFLLSLTFSRCLSLFLLSSPFFTFQLKHMMFAIFMLRQNTTKMYDSRKMIAIFMENSSVLARAFRTFFECGWCENTNGMLKCLSTSFILNESNALYCECECDCTVEKFL